MLENKPDQLPMPRKRAEAIRELKRLLNSVNIEKARWHFGKVELREFLDWMYGREPFREDEKL